MCRHMLAIVFCHFGLLSLWSSVTLTSCYFSLLLLQSSDALVFCRFGLLSLWSFVALVIFHFGILSLWSSVASVFCLFGLMLLWCYTAMAFVTSIFQHFSLFHQTQILTNIRTRTNKRKTFSLSASHSEKSFCGTGIF